MKRIFLITNFLFLSASLSACKIADDQRTDTGNISVLSFFEYEQSALSEMYQVTLNGNSTKARDALSSLLGYVMVSADTSTLATAAHPAYGCKFTSDDGLPVEVKYFADAGKLSITGDHIALPALTARKTASGQPIYFGNFYLPTGDFSFGMQGTLNFQTEFSVPDTTTGIVVQSGTDASFTLPSPQVSHDIIHLHRDQPFTVNFAAPAQTDFVRVTLEDAESPATTGIVCYGAPNEDIVVPPQFLAHFQTTTVDGRHPGSLFVDFYRVDFDKNLPRVKESLVRVFSRHTHGVRVLTGADNGQDVVLSLGQLNFE